MYDMKKLYIDSQIDVQFSRRGPLVSFFSGILDDLHNTQIGVNDRLFTNPTIFNTLLKKKISQLYLAGVSLDDNILSTARIGKKLGYSVIILTDLVQAREEKLKEGEPRESLMRFYYNLALKQDIFSLKTTDLSEEYHSDNEIYIPFSDWLDDNQCIKKETVEYYRRLMYGQSFITTTYLILLLF